MFDLFPNTDEEVADRGILQCHSTGIHTESLPCNYNLHKPLGLCQTRAKNAHTVNNYLTVSLLLLSYFCEEAVLRQEKYAQKNQSQLNSHRAAPGNATTQQTGNQSSPPLCPRLSAQRPATEKEQQSVREL